MPVKFFSQIPVPIWLLLAVVLGIWIARLFQMVKQSHQLRKALKELSVIVAAGGGHPDLGRGLTQDSLERIRAEADTHSDNVAPWWHRLEHHLQAYPTATTPREYFLARPVRDVLPDIELLEDTYHAGVFHSVPGILTSLGLAGTFGAILMGLFHVSYNPADPTQPVKGIDGLINSLSGKFTSSLVALALAVVFMWLEKHFEKANREAYDRLVRNLEEALPLLTPVRVLIDLQTSAIKQEVALRSISSEMVDQFKTAFTTEINPALSQQFSTQLMTEFQPTLARMAETLDTLTSTMKSIETSKHENLLKELSVVIQAMHGSILQGLQGMGQEFHQALSGAAKVEFENMQKSVEVARTTMDQLCERLDGMGSRMVESMGVVQASAEQQTQEALVHLSSMITRMNSDMKTLTIDTHDRIGALLESVAGGTQSFADAAERLGHAQDTIQGSLATHIEALADLKEVGGGLAALSTQFKDVTKRAGQMVTQQTEAANQLQELMAGLVQRQDADGTLLRDYAAAFSTTENRLGHLDQDLGKAFETIHEGLQTWTLSVEGCMKGLTHQTNEHLATVSRSFSRQIGELSEKLEDFNDALDRVVAGVAK